MGRTFILLGHLLALACAGCGAARQLTSAGPGGGSDPTLSRPAGPDDASAVPASATWHADPAAASALVFRPPVAAGMPPPDLSRASRQPSAFIGFEEPIIEYYHVTTIDRQVSGSHLNPFGSGWSGGYLDRYEREAVTEKVGVLHR